MGNTIRMARGNALLVAHRGVSGLERENTCAAFVAAGNRSYFGIETDVYRTADGRFVCHHDRSTGRVAAEDLPIETSTWEELRGLVLRDMDGQPGREDLRIPTLEDYVRICRRYGKTGVLELKSSFTQEELGRIVDILRAEEYLSGIVFIAFGLENLLGIRRLLPGHPCQYLRSEATPEDLRPLEEHGLDLDIGWQALTEELVRDLHAKGIRVNAWTVDRPEDAERLASWGVDYITTNILE